MTLNPFLPSRMSSTDLTAITLMSVETLLTSMLTLEVNI
jgi:hypothetical protein